MDTGHAQNGPNRTYDIIGDVHGCFDELCELLGELDYGVEASYRAGEKGWRVRPPPGSNPLLGAKTAPAGGPYLTRSKTLLGAKTAPAGEPFLMRRMAVFLGDLVDRGPRIPSVLRLVMGMVEAGTAICLLGNHDDKLLRKLKGRNVQIKHGLEVTLEQLAAEPPEFAERVRTFLAGLETHCVLDGGNLIVAHAGLKQSLHGRRTEKARDFALYGDVTGEKDGCGMPVRRDWARQYRGKAVVVYGHTPVAAPVWLHNTINIDTGCVFGGRLTALRYPELELMSVPARRIYAKTARPFLPAAHLAGMLR